MRKTGNGGASIPVIYFKGFARMIRYHPGKINYYTYHATSNGRFETPDVLGIRNVWHFVAIRTDGIGGTVPDYSINGAPFTPMTVGSPTAGGLSNDGGNNVRFLDQTGGGREFDGCIDDFRLHNEEITDAKVKELYEMGALRHYKVMENYPVEFSNKAAYSESGPFRIITGSAIYEQSDDSLERRKLTLKSNNMDVGLKTFSPRAFGAMYVKFKAINQLTFVPFFTDNIDSIIGNANGYYVYFTGAGVCSFARLTDGSGIALLNSFVTIGLGINELFITRDHEARFHMWVRGPSHSTWTQTSLATIDTTHQIGGYFGYRGYSGSELYDVIQFPYGGGLVPNDIAFIKD